MVVTDEQTKVLEAAQVFQWVAFKSVIIRNGELLMGTRLDSDEYGLYEFAGGKVEVGESIAQAIAREVREETGLVVVADAWRVLDIGQNEKGNTILIFVLVQVEEGELMPEVHELGDLRFYNASEVRSLMEAGKMRKSVEPIVTMYLSERV